MTSRGVLVALVLWTAAVDAGAATRRIGIVVGHNTGRAGRTPLRFAERDAGKFADLLADVGNVDPGDLFLLQGRGRGELTDVLYRARQRVRDSQDRPDTRVLMLFFFSGHSDGQVLELGQDTVSFAELETGLENTGADVRITIIDACQSGAAVRTKGGKPAPAFDLHLNDELITRGAAVITSSAADEVALESDEVRGGFFTHHLISGLRGAADISGDRRVTLAEAYRYAHDHTVSSSTATQSGAHHPEYDYRLSGQGELVLAFLDHTTSGVELPQNLERALIVHLARDQVVAELAGGGARRVALAPGRYSIRVTRGEELWQGRFNLRAGALRRIGWNDLAMLEPTQGTTRGNAMVERAAQDHDLGLMVSASAGGGLGVAEDLGAVGAARVTVELDARAGPQLAILGTAGSGPGFAEHGLHLQVGYHLGIGTERMQILASLSLGGGMIWQSSVARTPVGTLGPHLGLQVRLVGPIWLRIEGAAFAAILRVDKRAVIRPLGFGFVGLGVGG